MNAQCVHKTTCLYARKVIRFSRFQRFVEPSERTSGNEIAVDDEQVSTPGFGVRHIFVCELNGILFNLFNNAKPIHAVI
jgi:hypothetical protein